MPLSQNHARKHEKPGGTGKLARALCAALLAPLAACSYLPDLPTVRVPGMDRIVGDEGMFRDRKEEYLQAQTIPRMDIPDNLDSYIIDDLLVIPELPENGAQAFPDPPRPLQLEGRGERQVVIQRMRDSSWIVADVSPSQVWPRIRDYLRQGGMPVAVENPGQGLMETGWFALENNVLTRERLRVSVETGFQNNSSEIRLLHMSAPQALPAMEQVSWPEESADQEVAYDFLLDMSRYLAEVADLYQASTVSFLAGSLSSEGKAALNNSSSGNPVLTLRAGYDRSWAAVRRALERSGVEIVSENEEGGRIDVLYDPDAVSALDEEEDKPGFFRRVFTLNGLLSREEESHSYPVRLQLLDTGGQVEVLAVPRQGPVAAADAETLRALMQLLRNTIA